MTNMNQKNYQLCMDLLYADSEKEVITILQNHGYWDDNTKWKVFDDNENNYSTIGAQQANPVPALVEKIINSIDAVLLRECKIRGINPESTQAPKTMEEALEEYFNVKNGNLALITPPQRTKLAENIGFIATGQPSKPSYVIIDKGEGQTPNKMPSTFLSLNKSNKLRIPFVQGKYNMGGTGVLRFCGEEHLQLVVSKKHPKIIDTTDDSSTNWGFTIVRSQNPSEGRKCSMYTYLAPDRKILMFSQPEITIPVKTKGTQEIPILEWGSIIKLYEYGITPAALKTNILFDLYNYISLLTPKIGLPIRFYERRASYKGKSLESTMSGLHVRLEDDRSDNIEDGFPTSAEFRINGQIYPASIYVFKKGNAKNYRKNEGVIFTISGQTHGSINLSFFTRGKIGLSYIADSLLIIIDCNGIDVRTREKLFMNSRDRLSSGELTSEIEEKLIEILKNHSQLKALNDKRRREAIAEKLSDAKPLKDVLDDLLKNSPTLQTLFMKGNDLSNPFKSKLVGETKVFIGKKSPTYFRLMEGQKESVCHINQRFRVQFETDVENEYFIRDRHPGKFEFVLDNSDAEYVYNLQNGIFTLTVTLPATVHEGDILNGIACISDDTLIDPFCEQFTRKVLGAIDTSGGGNGRKPPAGNGKGNRQIPSGLSLPQVIEITEDEWQENEFDRFSALKVMATSSGGYDFYVNVDNVWLKTEMKQKRDLETAPLLKMKFRNGLVLFGMALLKDKDYLEGDAKDEQNDNETKIPIEELILKSSRSFAPIIIPLVDALGKLSEENLNQTEDMETEG